MATIQALHNLVDTNETQQGAADRITGAEVRTVDNTIIDEFVFRGSILVLTTADLATVPVTETRAARITSVGLFQLIQSVAAPDNIDTFPAIAPGWLWVKVADKTSIYFQNIPAATLATKVLFHEPDLSVSERSVNVAGGVPLLDSGGKILSTQLPPLAITDTFVNNSQASMLANAAQVGDISIRTDISQTFILQTSPATTLANWVQVLSPIAPVQSVNTRVGVVSLTTDDIPQGATNKYFSNTLARTALSANNGVFYDSSTGITSLGQTVGAGGDPAKLLVAREIPLNNLALTIRDGTLNVNNAPLNLNSTTTGFLLPRMTTAQKLAIVSPTTGLQVIDNTKNTLSYFHGVWTQFPEIWAETIASKAQHNSLTFGNLDVNDTFMRVQTQFWNGSSFSATRGYGIGYGALQNNTGDHGIAIGENALVSNSGANSIGIGQGACQINAGANCIGIGINALQVNPAVAAGIVAIGYSAGQNNTGDQSVFIGYLSGQNNTGANCNGIGGQVLQYNTGAYCQGIGYNSLQNNHGNYAVAMGQSSMDANTGHFCVGVGWGALERNTKDSVTGLGFASFQDNTGINSCGVGWTVGANNIGDRLSAIGYGAALNNCGADVTTAGYLALTYNNWSLVTSLGSIPASLSTFVDNVATVKNFASANINTAATTATITAHGFGATGSYVNLRFKVVTGTTSGFSDNQVFRFQIIDANTLKHSAFANAGAGTFSLTKDADRTNSTWIGANAVATKANQIMLGDGNIVEVAFTGKLNMLSGTTTAPANTTTPSTWANILMNGTNYKIALYL